MLNSTVDMFVKPMVNHSLSQSEMYDDVPTLKKTDKSIRTYIVKDIVTKLINFKMKIRGNVPRVELNKQLDDVNLICHTDSRSMINRVA